MKGLRFALLAGACIAVAACASQLPVVSPDQPHGLVISQGVQLPDHTYPARVVAIDGIPVPLEHRGALYVAPGLRTLRLSPAVADGEIRDVRQGTRQDHPDAYVDIHIQPNMRYVVAARETGEHMSEWRAVVTVVEPLTTPVKPFTKDPVVGKR